MSHLRSCLACACLAAAIVLLAVCTLAVLRVEQAAERMLLVLPAAALARVDAVTARVDIRTGEALAIVRGLPVLADRRIASIERVLDSRIAEAVKKLDFRAGEATGAVAAAQVDLSATLAETRRTEAEITAVVRDARDSWDDLYPDVRGLVESSTVAATGVAHTSEAVALAAPAITDSAVSIGKSAESVAGSAAILGADIAKPKGFWARFKSWLELAGKIGVRLL